MKHRLCGKCLNFTHPGEHRCPFCNADRAPTELTESGEAPSRSRAALLVAASMVIAGCPLAVRYGGPPPGSAPAVVAPAPVSADSAVTPASASPKR